MRAIYVAIVYRSHIIRNAMSHAMIAMFCCTFLWYAMLHFAMLPVLRCACYYARLGCATLCYPVLTKWPLSNRWGLLASTPLPSIAQPSA